MGTKSYLSLNQLMRRTPSARRSRKITRKFPQYTLLCTVIVFSPDTRTPVVGDVYIPQKIVDESPIKRNTKKKSKKEVQDLYERIIKAAAGPPGIRGGKAPRRRTRVSNKLLLLKRNGCLNSLKNESKKESFHLTSNQLYQPPSRQALASKIKTLLILSLFQMKKTLTMIPKLSRKSSSSATRNCQTNEQSV